MQRAVRADDTAAQDSHLEHAEERLAEANEELDQAVADAGAGRLEGAASARLPWKRIAWVTIALFLVALLVITVFELLAGRSVSSITGGSSNEGTTIGHVRDPVRATTSKPKDEPSQAPSESTEPSEPTESSEPTPTDAPTESVTPSETPGPDPDRRPVVDRRTRPRRRRRRTNPFEGRSGAADVSR